MNRAIRHLIGAVAAGAATWFVTRGLIPEEMVAELTPVLVSVGFAVYALVEKNLKRIMPEE